MGRWEGHSFTTHEPWCIIGVLPQEGLPFISRPGKACGEGQPSAHKYQWILSGKDMEFSIISSCFPMPRSAPLMGFCLSLMMVVVVVAALKLAAAAAAAAAVVEVVVVVVVVVIVVVVVVVVVVTLVVDVAL